MQSLVVSIILSGLKEISLYMSEYKQMRKFFSKQKSHKQILSIEYWMDETKWVWGLSHQQVWISY